MSRMCKLVSLQSIVILIMGASSVGPVWSDGHEEAAREIESALHHEPNMENGRELYRACAVCHLPNGWGTMNGEYPQVAGQLAHVIIKQLADIRALNRDNPTMLPFAKTENIGGPQEIADVAAYIARLPMTPVNDVGPGTDLAYGKKIYTKDCAECHGNRGEGDGEDHAPVIQGQHYRYLVRQFHWMRNGKRRNVKSEQLKLVKGYSEREINAVLDYVSRLRPDKDKLGEQDWRNPDFPDFVLHEPPKPGLPNL